MTEISKLSSITPKVFQNVFKEVLPEANFKDTLSDSIKAQEQKVLAQQKATPTDMAYLIAQANIQDPNTLDNLERLRKEDVQNTSFPNLQSAQNLNFLSERLEKTPFQVFIDKAIQSLENVSEMEFKVNDLIEGHIKGEVSIDEVSIETSKLNLAMSFATTVISSATQTFKELTQMAV